MAGVLVGFLLSSALGEIFSRMIFSGDFEGLKKSESRNEALTGLGVGNAAGLNTLSESSIDLYGVDLMAVELDLAYAFSELGLLTALME